MNKTIVGVGAVLAATALLAQDVGPEQMAAKCEAEGGCIIVTRDALMAALQVASKAAFKQGLRACNNAI